MVYRILLSLFLLLVPFVAKCQQIEDDVLTEDCRRIVNTKAKKFHIGGKRYSWSLYGIYDMHDVIYLLKVESMSKIPKNGVLMLKLGNTENFRLEAVAVDSESRNGVGFVPVIGTGSSLGSMYHIPVDRNVDYWTATYVFDDILLYKISEYGIVKLRIENEGGFYEWQRVYGSNALSRYLMKSFQNIQDRLLQPLDNTSNIESNF